MRVEVYKDKADEWRWVTIAGNGEQLASSTEGYKNRVYAVEQAQALNPGITVEVRGEEA